MWFILIFSKIFITAIFAKYVVGQHLIKFNEETLNKLRLTPSRLSTSVSYIDLELLNEYQCAIECIKDQSVCTGFNYGAINKTCSLYDDLTKVLDKDITAAVSFI
jgi:hypothetical protein